MKGGREVVMAPWTVTGSTYGNVGIVGFAVLGASALGSILVLDGTASKLRINAQITAGDNIMFTAPVPFTNAVVTVTAAAAYTVLYCPRP